MKKMVGFLFLLPIIFWMQCRKECHDAGNPQCSNYINPCSTVQPLSANFIIQEYPGGIISDPTWHYYPTDTIATGEATFIVSDKTVDSVKWHIGAGVYTQDSFYLNFGNYLQTSNQPIPITLTVYKHRNSCYPNDDTVKTLTQNLYFSDTTEIYGDYHGFYENNLADTGTITFGRFFYAYNNWGDTIGGLTKGCGMCYAGQPSYRDGGIITLFYRGIIFNTDILSCGAANGNAVYNINTDSILVQFTTDTAGSGTGIHIFQGIKVQ